MKVLCLCRAGLNRSRYMADVIRERGWDAKHAGVDPRSPNPVTREMVDWADIIIAAQEDHVSVLNERFTVKKRIISLHVHNDIYASEPMREQVREQLLPLINDISGS